MKERPILFSGPMVRALLDGRKTRTRRVVKPQPEWSCSPLEFTNSPGVWAPNEAEDYRRCPYGVPGDRLWVRETWQRVVPLLIDPTTKYEYLATVRDGCHPARWKPSIHMPRVASRITLEVVRVRVERVQQITEADAIAEGCGRAECGALAVLEYCRLWNEINGPGAWAENPWVWVVEFKRIGGGA